jgi:hypothetical protein
MIPKLCTVEHRNKFTNAKIILSSNLTSSTGIPREMCFSSNREFQVSPIFPSGSRFPCHGIWCSVSIVFNTIHVFLTWALFGGGQLHSPATLPREKASVTHWIGGWVGPRTDLQDVEKGKIVPLPGLELQPLGCPARSQSLYWLRYPGSILNECHAFRWK